MMWGMIIGISSFLQMLKLKPLFVMMAIAANGLAVVHAEQLDSENIHYLMLKPQL